jgi:alanyl-tRNA synthetase
MDEMERGYLSDPLQGDFTATVKRVEDAGDGQRKVWLDRTLFYPESGGQPDDRGTLGGFKITAVSEDDSGVCHLVQGALEVGDEINGHVDMARRFDHMQQHTGQHLLSRVFVSLGGLMTVGFHLGEKASTIDLSGAASDEMIAKAEREANAAVFQDLEVSARVVTRDEYESAQESGDGVRSRLPEGVSSIRIVEIEETDSSTCCGTHCLSTGMIGIIKIIGTEKVRGGTRIEFLCGGRALGDYGEKHGVLTAVGNEMSTDWRELGSITEKLVTENKSLRKERDALSRELAGYKAEEIGKPTGEIGGYGLVRKVFDEASPGDVREMATKIRESGENIILFGIISPAPGLVFACSPGIDTDMGAALREAAAVIGGKGGGGKDFAQGGGGDPSKMEEALDAAEKKIEETLA